MNLHLTHEQLCDVLLADSSLPQESSSPVVHDHLRACLLCSAELESLRASLALFRDASSLYADQVFSASYRRRESIAPPHHFLTQPLYWAAAAVVMVAACFPISLHRQHQAYPAAAVVRSVPSAMPDEADEALLEDVDQTLSADVPSPMEPLADPTAGAPSTQSPSDQRN